jgi:hypothetical protein
LLPSPALPWWRGTQIAGEGIGQLSGAPATKDGLSKSTRLLRHRTTQRETGNLIVWKAARDGSRGDSNAALRIKP